MSFLKTRVARSFGAVAIVCLFSMTAPVNGLHARGQSSTRYLKASAGTGTSGTPKDLTDSQAMGSGTSEKIAFADICPRGKELFTRGAPKRKLDAGLPWQWDYPILIYNIKGARAKLELAAAKKDLEDQKASVERSIAMHNAAKEKLDKTPANDPKRQAAEAQENKLAANLETAQQQMADAQSKVAAKSITAATDDTFSGKLFWREAGVKDAITEINNPSFLSPVYTTEKVLVMICNSAYGDGASVDDTAYTVNIADDTGTTESLREMADLKNSLDRLYVLDASKVKSNSLERLEFKLNNGTTTDTLATAVLARHKVIHFSIGGGLLVTNAPSTAYSVLTVPTVVTTTSTVASTTTTNGVVTSTTNSTTPAVTAATASYVFAQKQSGQQTNAITGVTWYPFGYDTYPFTKRNGFAGSYASHKPWGPLGLFLGTTVNSFGNFTVAPAYEVFPGIQVMAGLTLRNKTTLSQGIVTCAGTGTSPSFTTQPTGTVSSTTSSTSNGTTTVITSTTTTTTTATSGCSNGDKATLILGSAAPTQTVLKPAFSFGILFNSNLLSRFTGFGK